MKITIKIDPVTAPRQTRKDRFSPSSAVRRYWAYKDELRLRCPRLEIPRDVELVSLDFVIAMPGSWSRRKRAELDGRPHRQKPDIDNLVKAFLDTFSPQDDSYIPAIEARKRWGEEGLILFSFSGPNAEMER